MVQVAEIKADTVEPEAKRILVAEDNQTTQELLELLLTQRGHQVDVVSDGEMALNALRRRSYDVVLLDFHLPKMDGLQVAAAYRSGRSGETSPRFIAITADMKGLLSQAANSETFDQVMAKPFDLEDICNVIEGQATEISVSETPAATATEVVAPEPARELPSVSELRKKPPLPVSPIQELGYELLSWPDDFNAENRSARALQGSLGRGRFDGLLIREKLDAGGPDLLWQAKALYALPVIDLTGTLGAKADIDASRLSLSETGQIGEMIEAFQNRLAKLSDDLLYSDDMSDKVLGRAYLSGGKLLASYDANATSWVSFNTLLSYSTAENEAAKLVKAGYLAPQFFDRMHVCDRCGSSRFNVREECPQCRSADLREEAYLHHFKCAYQGPESDFRRGDDLVCPKCRQELRHFSVDYDKPGTVMVCENCGSATSEPDIGFICLDCEAHASGDMVAVRDVHSYVVTERGRAYAEAGKILLEEKSRALRLAELPLELIVLLNSELKQYETSGAPFTLLDISYRKAHEIEQEHGPRQFAQTRRQFLENMRNVLPEDDRVMEGSNHDVVLMKGVDVSGAQPHIDEVVAHAKQNLRVDLMPQVHAYGPEAFQ